jgi:hypothetical protein
LCKTRLRCPSMIGLPTTTSAVFDSSVVMLVATHEQLLMKDAV